MDKHIGQHKAPRVKLEPNIEKIIEAICYVVAEGERRHIALSQYDIVKTIFLADRSHLNNYGRPITFDNYIAMKDGPVPSLAYDLLKENANQLKRYGIKSLPWRKRKNQNYFIYYLEKPYRDREILTASDKQALADAMTTIKSLTFRQIRSLTHEDPAYAEAWDGQGSSKSYLMSYGMLFDSPDYEAAEHVQFLSKHQ